MAVVINSVSPPALVFLNFSFCNFAESFGGKMLLNFLGYTGSMNSCG